MVCLPPQTDAPEMQRPRRRSRHGLQTASRAMPWRHVLMTAPQAAPPTEPRSFGSPLPREGSGELPPGVDRELAVDARQVDLHGLYRHEERLRDLLVALVLGGELGHAALARRQRVDAAEDLLPRARPSRGELLVCPLDERGRSRP